MQGTMLEIISILFHPDFTVGCGISPHQPHCGSWTIPPVGNFTPPRELLFDLIIRRMADLSTKNAKN